MAISHVIGCVLCLSSDTKPTGIFYAGWRLIETDTHNQFFSTTGSSWTAVSGGGGSGETNTMSNVGVGGVGLYDTKTGVNFDMKTLNAGSNKITVANDTINKEVDIDVAQANLDHAVIGGAVGDANIASHTTTKITTTNHALLPSDAIYTTNTATLSNKTIDTFNNVLALRIFDIICYQVGATYVAQRYDGSIISSGATAETVLQAALGFGGGATSISVAIFGVWTFSSGFTGVTVPANCYVHSHNAQFIVPNAYTGTAVKVTNAWFGGLIGPLNIFEAGTAARNWTAISLENTDVINGIAFFTLEKLYLYQCGLGIKLSATAAGKYVNGNFFNDILIDNSRKGIQFVTSSGGNTDSNVFKGVFIETGPTGVTTNGFQDIQGSRNTFLHCYCFDFEATASEANILASNSSKTTSGTVIIGGQMTGASGTFTDLAADTMIIDNKQKAKFNSQLTLGNYVDMKRISAPGNPATDWGRVYVKQIDTNNDGIFTKIKKAGAFVEVQLV